jgi:hypothetical protein
MAAETFFIRIFMLNMDCGSSAAALLMFRKPEMLQRRKQSLRTPKKPRFYFLGIW